MGINSRALRVSLLCWQVLDSHELSWVVETFSGSGGGKSACRNLTKNPGPSRIDFLGCERIMCYFRLSFCPRLFHVADFGYGTMPVVYGPPAKMSREGSVAFLCSAVPGRFLAVHKTLTLSGMRILVLQGNTSHIFTHKVLSLKSFSFLLVMMTSPSHTIAVLGKRSHRRIKGERMGQTLKA